MSTSYIKRLICVNLQTFLLFFLFLYSLYVFLCDLKFCLFDYIHVIFFLSFCVNYSGPMDSLSICKQNGQLDMLATICPRSHVSFYIVSLYIKWETTSWTHNTTFVTVLFLIIIILAFHPLQIFIFPPLQAQLHAFTFSLYYFR